MKNEKKNEIKKLINCYNSCVSWEIGKRKHDVLMVAKDIMYECSKSTGFKWCMEEQEKERENKSINFYIHKGK